MKTCQDSSPTVRSAPVLRGGGALGPRLLWRVPADAPAASCAERIHADWRASAGSRPPALVLAHPRVHALLVEQIRRRLRSASPQPGDASAYAADVAAALHGGATLLCGATGDASGLRPGLLLVPDLDAPWLRRPIARGPLLCVLRATDSELQADLGRILPEDLEERPLAASFLNP